MHDSFHRLWRIAGLALLLPLFGCRHDGPEPLVGLSPESPGNREAPSSSPAAAIARDAGTDADASEEPEETEEDEPPPDIGLLHGNTRAEKGKLGLSLDVAEKGPNLPWTIALVNEGEQSVRLIADARLLWFEVTVPGKRKKVTCRLPDEMFPSHADSRFAVVLDPGEGVVQSFDPRLYCFAAEGQRALVPGALVRPYFGWQPSRATGTRRPLRSRPELERPPFVAMRVSPEEGKDASGPPSSSSSDATREQARGTGKRAKNRGSTPRRAAPRAKAGQAVHVPQALSDDAGAGDADETRLKAVEGQPFALRSEYKEWSSTRLDEDRKLRQNPGPLELKLVQGADAYSERNAIVTLKLVNRSDHGLRVYFRRELVSFEIVGPDGIATCDPKPDNRAPDAQEYTFLRSGGSIDAPSRLIELCPQDTFARPGLYLVHARFDANQDGAEFGLDAFVGRVVSLSPAVLRIRTGELPLLQPEPMRTIRVIQGKAGNANAPNAR